MYCKHYLPLLLLFLGTIFHSKSQKLTENNIKKAYAEVEGKIKEDHLRPAFHLTPPSGCMGDPNGGIYHNGRYHIFYGHNPFSGSYGGWFWGHASSKDLLNWRHEPPMLTPAFDLGISSVGSGSTIVNDQGKPLAFHSVGKDGSMKFWQAQFTDEDLTSWEHKGKNPVLTLDYPGLPPFDSFWRDPFVFKTEGRTFMIACADLLEEDYVPVPIFEAENKKLTEWDYKDLLFTYPKHKLRNLEVPEFRPIGDKWILLSSSDAPKDRVYYFIGHFDTKTFKFIPESEGVLDHSNHYYAQETILDDKGNLNIMAWIPGWDRPFLPNFRTGDEKLADRPWNGCFAIPRIITLNSEGKLIRQPVPQMKQLRGEETIVPPFELPVDGPTTAVKVLESVRGNQMEIKAELDLHTSSFCGMNVLCDSSGTGGMYIIWSGDILNIDGVEVEMDNWNPGETLELQVFVDKQIVEVFINGGEASVSRLVKEEYISGNHVAITSLGGRAILKGLTKWKLNPISQ